MRIFFSRVNFLCCLLFGVRSTPVLSQWHAKDPCHSAKNAGGRLHSNTHTALTQRSRSGLTMPLSRYSVEIYQATNSHATRQGNSRPQSSQLAEPLWTDPGLKSEISVRELISIQKKKRSAGGDRMLQPSPKSSGARRQATITACLRHCFHKRCLKLLNTLRDASHFQWLLLCALPVISLDVSLSWTEDSFLEVFEDGWRTLSYASTGFPFYFLRFSSKLIGSVTM